VTSRLGSRRLVLWSAAGLLVLIALIVFAFWVVPLWLVPEGELQTGAQRLKAESDVRSAALQVIAGLVVAAGLGLTARSVALTARAIDLTREGQVTDRYTQAVEQLGHDGLAVRIGALYALERIADDSERDRQMVIEVVTAYIREHAKPPTSPPADIGKEQPSPDIAAAVNVVRRWRWGHRVDLEGAYLAGARLSGVRLPGAVLSRATLAGARLAKADLSSAFLNSTDLSRARLPAADLTGAHLEGAKFDGATLDRAVLTDASYSRWTVWPEGLEPEARGAVFEAYNREARARSNQATP